MWKIILLLSCYILFWSLWVVSSCKLRKVWAARREGVRLNYALDCPATSPNPKVVFWHPKNVSRRRGVFVIPVPVCHQQWELFCDQWWVSVCFFRFYSNISYAALCVCYESEKLWMSGSRHVIAMTEWVSVTEYGSIHTDCLGRTHLLRFAPWPSHSDDIPVSLTVHCFFDLSRLFRHLEIHQKYPQAWCLFCSKGAHSMVTATCDLTLSDLSTTGGLGQGYRVLSSSNYPLFMYVWNHHTTFDRCVITPADINECVIGGLL
jgi:hypothetical protein